MATSTGESIIARARTIAAQTGIDANQSPIIDSKGALRVLLNNAIREVYRNHANDQKFFHDIVTRTTVTIGTGTGGVPDTLMREFLPMAEYQDANNSLISYYGYDVDFASTANYRQLGYVTIKGDTFYYRAPFPTLANYSGNLYVTCPSFPTFPASLASNITFPSLTVIDDIVLALAGAIVGREVVPS